MNEKELEKLRYPIGKFKTEDNITTKMIKEFILEIEKAPDELKRAVNVLSETQLNTPYRSGGWTVKQVVHHLADSHMNSYIRFKLALTEKSPQIKPYDEAEWAKLKDSEETPVQVSVDLFAALHKRWIILLNNLSSNDLKKTFFHPERGLVRLDKTIALYAWHGKHHIAHINSLRKRMGW